MLDTRLELALEAGLHLPGRTVVLQPAPDARLETVTQAQIVHPVKPVLDAYARRGFDVSPDLQKTCPASIVCLPRAKAEAFAMIEAAARLSDGPVVVDGQKGDGIDSVLKAVRARNPVSGVISKAHGKLFWIESPEPGVFDDWLQGPALSDGGFWTAPGVFSADGIDPGSALLADALPDDLEGRVADLGGGWGFLSAHVLARAGVEQLDVVEAHHMALQCAEHNVTDPRARFHWADALEWRSAEPLDAVVMNPPFHKGKTGDPTLGQGFIAAAANNLKPKGVLWMVANRHLPYEDALAQHFAETLDLGGDRRFKLIRAERPRRRR